MDSTSSKRELVNTAISYNRTYIEVYQELHVAQALLPHLETERAHCAEARIYRKRELDERVTCGESSLTLARV